MFYLCIHCTEISNEVDETPEVRKESSPRKGIFRFFCKSFSIQEFKFIHFFFGSNQFQRNIFLNADCIRAYVYSTIVQLMFHYRANSNKHLNDDNVFEL